MRLGIPLAALVFTLPAAVAQEKAADFSEGLKQLAALGLPPMDGATWVRKPRAEISAYSDSAFRSIDVRLRGAVWKLPGDNPRYLDFGSPRQFDADPKKETAAAKATNAEPGMLDRMLKNFAAEQPAKPKPAPAAASSLDLEADVKALIAAVPKLSPAGESSTLFGQEFNPLPGRCLLFAAQLQAAGKPALAAELAAKLFSQFSDKTALIDSAIDILASSEYQAVTDAFFNDHNWVSYNERLKSLLAKYPRGWSSAGAVAMLMGPLEKRASGIQPPPPSLPGMELNPEVLPKLARLLEPAGDAKEVSDEEYARSRNFDLNSYPASQRAAVIAAIRRNDPGDQSPSQRLWTLYANPDNAKSTDALAALQAMGMDGVIALTAIIRDETLTLFPMPAAGQTRSHSYYYGESRSEEEIAATQYKNMARPRSRGEIAAAVLSQVIPADEDRSEPEPAVLAEQALAFWKDNHDKTPIDLAVIYMNDGNETQRMLAASYLAESKEPLARETLEKTIITSSNPVDYASFVTVYLTRLGPDGRKFFDAYAKVFHETMDGVDLSQIGYSSGSYPVRESGVDRFLGKLSVKVGVVSPDQLLAKAMQTGDDGDWAVLGSGLSGTGAADILTLLGPAAAKANPEQLPKIFQLLSNRIGNGYEGDKPFQTNGELPEKTMEVWKSLLDRTEPIQKGTTATDWEIELGASNAGDVAALLLDMIVFPESLAQERIYAEIEGSSAGIAAFSRKRVTAWFNHQEPVKWPNADDVPDARKKEISAQLGKLPAAQILPYATALSPSEKAWVCASVDGYGRSEDSPVPAGIAELRLTVVACRSVSPAIPHDAELLKSAGIAEGYQISPGGLGSLMESLTAKAAGFSRTKMTFVPGPMSLGYVASAHRMDDQEGAQGLSRYAEYFWNATGGSNLQCQEANLFWTLNGGKVSETIPNSESDRFQERTSEDQTLNSVFEQKSAIPFPISIEILTAADAKKLKPANW